MTNLNTTPPSARTRDCSSTPAYATLWDIVSTRNISAEHGESTAEHSLRDRPGG